MRTLDVASDSDRLEAPSGRGIDRELAVGALGNPAGDDTSGLFAIRAAGSILRDRRRGPFQPGTGRMPPCVAGSKREQRLCGEEADFPVPAGWTRGLGA